MKTFSYFLLILYSFPIYASAPELECFKQASAAGIEKPASIELCGQLDDSLPHGSITCYRKVMQLGVLGTQTHHAIRLCSNARSDGPATCYRDAVNLHSLTLDEAIELCRTKPKVIRVPASIPQPMKRKKAGKALHHKHSSHSPQEKG